MIVNVFFFLLGYQSRSQALSKQLHDLTEQIEAARSELDTYTFLKKHEEGKYFLLSRPTILWMCVFVYF